MQVIFQISRAAGLELYNEFIRARQSKDSRSSAGLWGGNSRHVPIEDLRAGPIEDAVEAARMLVHRLQVFDAMGLPADIGMDCQGHDLGPVLSFGIKPLELVDGAPGEIFAS